MADITNSGVLYVRNCITSEVLYQPTEFVFANKPLLVPTDPVDKAQSMPSAGEIVARFPVQSPANVADNGLVYSIMLGTDVGGFEYNWVGLVGHDGSLIQVAYEPLRKKTKTASGVIGNTIVRNFIMYFDNSVNASEFSGVIGDASTWQFDFDVYITDAVTRSSRAQTPPSNSILVPGKYYISENKVYTLPSTDLSQGDEVILTKIMGLSPTIKCAVAIKTIKGEDLEVIYDMHGSLHFTWNGGNWEI